MTTATARDERARQGQRLLRRSSWIFDLDGTLTLPVHDFAFIRRELAIPDGSDILGHLDGLHPAEAALRRGRLDVIERQLADRAEAAPGAGELLALLAGEGVQLGILTRNSREIALLTLEVIGFGRYFTVDDVLGRDEVAPKPDPAGILHLLDRWESVATSAVMVGDYLFDLEAGRAAGVATIHVGRPDGQRWPQATDVQVASLLELAELLAEALAES